MTLHMQPILDYDGLFKTRCTFVANIMVHSNINSQLLNLD